MNNGDIFEFLGWDCKQSQSHHEFYDVTLRKWIPVGNNTFMCIALVKNDEWSDSYHDHSLHFTNGRTFFHARVDVTATFFQSGGGKNFVSSTRIINQ